MRKFIISPARGHTLGLLLLLAPALAGQTVPFTHYSVRDGMVSDFCTAIVQDSRGYLWTGTWEGISVYDGVRFRNFTPTDGLPNSFINCITELSDGSVVAGMNLDGYCVMRDWRITAHLVDSSLESNRVFCAAPGSRGAWWCGTEAGLYLIREWRAARFHPQVNTGSIQGLVPAGEGVLYVLADSGVFSVQPEGTLLEQVSLPDPEAEVTVMGKSEQGGVWLASRQRVLYRIAKGLVVQARPMDAEPEFFLLDDGEGSVWSRSGTTLLSIPVRGTTPRKGVRYSSPEGLNGTHAAAGLVDREGNLWFAGNGISKVSDLGLVRFDFDTPPHAVTSDSSHHLWALFEDHVLELWESGDGLWRKERHAIVNHPNPKLLFIDRGEYLWLGHDDGTLYGFRLDPRKGSRTAITFVHSLPPPPGKRVQLTRFLIDRHGYAWLGLQNEGIAVFETTGPRIPLAVFPTGPEFPMYSIRALHEDAQGNIWVGEFGQRGVVVLRGGIKRTGNRALLAREDGLTDGSVRSFAHEGDTVVWIGTRYGGLARCGATIETYGMREGLASNAVWGVSVDSAGVWCATGAGLSFIARGSNRIESVPAFGRLPLGTCGSLGNGTLWVLGSSLWVYRYTKSLRNSTPPLAHISNFSVNGIPRGTTGSGVFAYDENHCTIEFVGISLTDESRVTYQFMLDGAENTWHAPTAKRDVTYGSLPPGEYTFLVKALNADGIASVEPAVVRFQIHAPFWGQWWFRLLAFLAGIGGVAAVFQTRLQRLKRDHRAQQEFSRRLVESQEKERKRIGAALHDSIGQDLLMIRHGIERAAQTVGNTVSARADLLHLSSVAADSLNEVRNISYDLHPHTLDTLGLQKGIQSVINKVSQNSLLTITSTLEGIDGVLPKEEEINLYRIVQEGLNNITKHSGSANARVSIRRIDKSIELVIEDDGRGFNLHAHARDGETKGFGLSGIAERVKLLGGTLSIRTSPGAGTILLIRIPVQSNH